MKKFVFGSASLLAIFAMSAVTVNATELPASCSGTSTSDLISCLGVLNSILVSLRAQLGLGDYLTGDTGGFVDTSTPLAIPANSLPGATRGTSYSATLGATGGTSPYTWTVAALPTGLTFNGVNGITGTPSATGTFAVAARVTDASGASVNKNLTLMVATPGPAAGATFTVQAIYEADISGGVLPGQSKIFRYRATPTGGFTGPVTFAPSAVSNIPSGMNYVFNPASLTFSGEPVEFTLTLSVPIGQIPIEGTFINFQFDAKGPGNNPVRIFGGLLGIASPELPVVSRVDILPALGANAGALKGGDKFGIKLYDQNGQVIKNGFQAGVKSVGFQPTIILKSSRSEKICAKSTLGGVFARSTDGYTPVKYNFSYRTVNGVLQNVSTEDLGYFVVTYYPLNALAPGVTSNEDPFVPVGNCGGTEFSVDQAMLGGTVSWQTEVAGISKTMVATAKTLNQRLFTVAPGTELSTNNTNPFGLRIVGPAYVVPGEPQQIRIFNANISTSTPVKISYPNLPAGLTASLGFNVLDTLTAAKPTSYYNLNSSPTTAAGDKTVTIRAEGGGVTKDYALNVKAPVCRGEPTTVSSGGTVNIKTCFADANSRVPLGYEIDYSGILRSSNLAVYAIEGDTPSEWRDIFRGAARFKYLLSSPIVTKPTGIIAQGSFYYWIATPPDGQPFASNYYLVATIFDDETGALLGEDTGEVVAWPHAAPPANWQEIGDWKVFRNY